MSTPFSLPERVLAHLRQHPGQYAREIAQALGCEKTAVNSCLYGELSGRVVQTHPYRWALASNAGPADGSASPAAAPAHLETPVAKLSRYYLDCISFDDEGGASFFAESKFEQSYVELPKNPLLTEQGLAPMLGLAPVQRLLAHVRQDRKRLGLVMGYPCYLKRIRSKRGWEGMMVEPLFLFPVTSPSAGSGESYVLDTGSFSLNFPLVARLSGVEGQAGMEEGLALLAEL